MVLLLGICWRVLLCYRHGLFAGSLSRLEDDGEKEDKELRREGCSGVEMLVVMLLCGEGEKESIIYGTAVEKKE